MGVSPAETPPTRAQCSAASSSGVAESLGVPEGLDDCSPGVSEADPGVPDAEAEGVGFADGRALGPKSLKKLVAGTMAAPSSMSPVSLNVKATVCTLPLRPASRPFSITAEALFFPPMTTRPCGRDHERSLALGGLQLHGRGGARQGDLLHDLALRAVVEQGGGDDRRTLGVRFGLGDDVQVLDLDGVDSGGCVVRPDLKRLRVVAGAARGQSGDREHEGSGGEGAVSKAAAHGGGNSLNDRTADFGLCGQEGPSGRKAALSVCQRPQVTEPSSRARTRPAPWADRPVSPAAGRQFPSGRLMSSGRVLGVSTPLTIRTVFTKQGVSCVVDRPMIDFRAAAHFPRIIHPVPGR